MRTLGELIREARLGRHWTQVELAQQINVSRSTISNWENIVSEPDFTTLCILSSVLRYDFIPRHAENTADSQPTERKMHVFLGESSEIAVKFPANACEITAGTIDFRVNGSDLHGNTIEFHITAPFTLEFQQITVEYIENTSVSPEYGVKRWCFDCRNPRSTDLFEL